MLQRIKLKFFKLILQLKNIANTLIHAILRLLSIEMIETAFTIEFSNSLKYERGS